MIFAPSKAIEAALRAHNFNCSVVEAPSGGSSAVVTGFDLKSGDAVTFHFISMNDQNDVALRAFHFAKGDGAKLAPVVNDLNCKFRFAKFTLRDGEVNLEMDAPQETTDVGKVAFELLARSLDILAEAAADLKAAGATLEAASASSAEPAAPAEPAPKKGLLGGLFGNGK